MNEQDLFGIHQHSDVTELRIVEAELSDLVIHDRLTQQFVEYVDDHNPKKVIVNFDVVKFCTSGVIGSLLKLNKILGSNDAQLRLCCVNGYVRETFQSLNLIDTIFEVDDSLSESVSALD